MFKSLFALPLFLMTYLNAQQVIPEFDGVVNISTSSTTADFQFGVYLPVEGRLVKLSANLRNYS